MRLLLRIPLHNSFVCSYLDLPPTLGNYILQILCTRTRSKPGLYIIFFLLITFSRSNPIPITILAAQDSGLQFSSPSQLSPPQCPGAEFNWEMGPLHQTISLFPIHAPGSRFKPNYILLMILMCHSCPLSRMHWNIPQHLKCMLFVPEHILEDHARK